MSTPVTLFAVALACACFFGTALFSRVAVGDEPPAKPAAKGKSLYAPKITVSKETTWAVEPVGPRGFVDYPAALDRLGSERVTKENNAVVLLYQATGRDLEHQFQPDEIFRRLGIAPPPEQGDYFVSLAQWLKRTKTDWSQEKLDAFDESLKQTRTRAWTATEFPEIAQWLDSIELPLEQAVLATGRTDYYSPSLPKDGPEGKLEDIPLPALTVARELAHALISRALLRLGNHDPQLSWADLIAAHRLGRLIGRGPLEIEGAIGHRVESMAMDAELLFLSETRPASITLISQYVQALDALPARSLMVDKINGSARMLSLDSCQQVARGRMKFADLLPGKSPNTIFEDAVESMMLQSVEWDAVLKSVNQWHDSQFSAAKLPTYAEQMRGLRKLEISLREAARTQLVLNPQSLIGNRPQATAFTTAVFGHIFAGRFYRQVWPDAKNLQQFQNLKLAFALAAWRTEHDAYPVALSELKPKYLAEIPIDLFNNQPLHYERVDTGYRFSSVGINQEDNKSETSKDTLTFDDLIVEMPVPR